MHSIRPLKALTASELQMLARDMADADEQLVHGFEPQSTQAYVMETAYAQRRNELQAARTRLARAVSEA